MNVLVETKGIGKGITAMLLAFLVGCIVAWLFVYGLELCHFTVLPIDLMQDLFGI